MKEKIRLLMEEAGCDEGQAELALEAVHHDVEQAIRNIGALLKDFVVIKGKFFEPAHILSGLFIAIFNIRCRSIIRIHTIISYNPSIFETSLNIKWIAFEKQIFVHRLQDGTIRRLSQRLEQALNDCFRQDDPAVFFNMIVNGDIEETKRFYSFHIAQFLKKEYVPQEPDTVEITGELLCLLEREELNVTQFKHLEEQSNTVRLAAAADTNDRIGPLYLQILFSTDPGGIRACDLMKGAMVQSLIIDQRDIAQYLSRLMGGRIGNEIIPLPSSVIAVNARESYIEVQTWLAPNIVGLAKLLPETQIKVLYPAEDQSWQRIYPW